MSDRAAAKREAAIMTSKDPFAGLCNEKLLTPEGCDWCKSAVDPFHDFELDNLRGYPDLSTDPSVVVKIRQAITIAAPPTTGADDTWDCHLVLSPVDWAQAFNSSLSPGVQPARYETLPSAASSGLIQQPVFPFTQLGRMDGLVINSVPSGHDSYTPRSMGLAPAGGNELQNINLDSFFDFGATDLGVYRITASGFEVVNTTAQINKQGAVTVYEFGNSYERSDTSGSAQGHPIAPATEPYSLSSQCTAFRCPPNTLAQAKIMPGARTWAASDGCYNTAKFQGDNPFQSATARNFVFAQNEDVNPNYSTIPPATTVAGSFVSGGLSLVAAGGVPLGLLDAPRTHFSRMNTNGALFSGLSQKTTLFVTWRVHVERLPSANKPAFLALAQPSADFDPRALELYSRICIALPPGCPQGYNDLGKWFSWAVKAAKAVLPAVFPSIRTASMIANAAGPVMQGLVDFVRPHAEKAAVNRLQNAARNKAGRRRAIENFGLNGTGKPGVQQFAQQSSGQTRRPRGNGSGR